MEGGVRRHRAPRRSGLAGGEPEALLGGRGRHGGGVPGGCGRMGRHCCGPGSAQSRRGARVPSREDRRQRRGALGLPRGLRRTLPRGRGAGAVARGGLGPGRRGRHGADLAGPAHAGSRAPAGGRGDPSRTDPRPRGVGSRGRGVGADEAGASLCRWAGRLAGPAPGHGGGHAARGGARRGHLVGDLPRAAGVARGAPHRVWGGGPDRAPARGASSPGGGGRDLGARGHRRSARVLAAGHVPTKRTLGREGRSRRPAGPVGGRIRHGQAPLSRGSAGAGGDPRGAAPGVRERDLDSDCHAGAPLRRPPAVGASARRRPRTAASPGGPGAGSRGGAVGAGVALRRADARGLPRGERRVRWVGLAGLRPRHVGAQAAEPPACVRGPRVAVAGRPPRRGLAGPGRAGRMALRRWALLRAPIPPGGPRRRGGRRSRLDSGSRRGCRS